MYDFQPYNCDQCNRIVYNKRGCSLWTLPYNKRYNCSLCTFEINLFFKKKYKETNELIFDDVLLFDTFICTYVLDILFSVRCLVPV